MRIRSIRIAASRAALIARSAKFLDLKNRGFGCSMGIRLIGSSRAAKLGVAAALVVLSGTAEAGQRWVKLPTVRYTLNNKQDAIAFIDTKRGWYGNGTGRLYRTGDGGAHWQQVWRKKGTYVRALEFIDEKLGLLGNVGPGYFPNVSDRQPLYMTRDGGAHFSAVRSADGRTIAGVCAIDVVKTERGLAAIRAGGRVGGPASMIESVDGGKTWRARDMNNLTGMILDIKFLDADTGFIAGASEPSEDKAHARILKTADGGKTWHSVFESDRAGEVNWKLSFPSRKVGYATIISYQAPNNEARGYVMKTEDGSGHWSRQTVTQDRNWIPYGVGFIDEKHGFVGGSTGGYETRDGGTSWQQVEMGLSVNKFRFVRRTEGGVVAFAIGQDVRRLDLPLE